LGIKRSEVTRAKISASKIGKNHPFFGKTQSEESIAKNMASQRNSLKTEVTDLELNVTTLYFSKRAAARALNIPQ
jgi:hypothetical protein